MSQPTTANRFVTRMLCSPLHVFMSGMLLITVTGRKSSRPISTPVNYVRDGDRLIVTSRVDRTWWRNLRGGAPITLRLNGRTYRADAVVIEDRPTVEKELLCYFQLARRTFAGIHLTPDGQPTKPEKFAEVAKSRVIVEISCLAPS